LVAEGGHLCAAGYLEEVGGGVWEGCRRGGWSVSC
jgi:hypothetical protein